MKLTDFKQSTGNWRQQLQINERKTRWIVATFLMIYISVGLLIDAFLLHHHYPGASLGQYFYALISFQVFPLFTCVMGIIALISLWLTFALYDRIMLLGTQSHQITPQTARNIQEMQLYNVVEEMKIAAGMQYMPKVYIIEANYMNAFASGYSEKSAMVAITRGLVEKLDRSELQAVMAHELSHIRHHDTKVTLMVAILSNILLIAVDILFYSILFRRDDERRDNNQFLMIIMALRYLLPFITMVLALFLSRTREFMADAGSVELMRNNEPMARALLKISQDHEQNADQYASEYSQTPHEEIRQASYLYDPLTFDAVKSLNTIFSTHPNLEQRLSAIGFRRKNKT